MPKKYSLNVEDGKVVSVEVDGVRYERPNQIPDPKDRAQIKRLMYAPGKKRARDDEFGEDWDKEFEHVELEAKRQAGSAGRAVIAIFAGVSILGLAIAGFSGFNTLRGLRRQMSAQGRVVELVVRSDSSGREFFYPVVEFTRDGERAVEQVSVGSWPAPYQPGDAVSVYWDPQQPHNVNIRSSDSGYTPWILTGITGALGVAFGVAAVFAWWISKEEREPEAKPAV